MVVARSPEGGRQLRTLGTLPLPRNPLRLQAGRDSLRGTWCGGRGSVSSADQVIAVDNCSSDEAADREDQLSDEGGEKENELHQRIEEVKAGSNEDPSQTEKRPQETPYPEHGMSMGCSRAIWVAQVALAASDRRKDRNDHDRNDDREAALSA